MNQSLACASLALPRLPLSIPMAMYLPGGSNIAASLALALLEANQITDQMLAPGPNAPLMQVLLDPNEADLSARALTTWWNAARAACPTRVMHWNLHVQALNEAPSRDLGTKDATGWFCLTRASGDIPRFALAPRILQLEDIAEGFGQTVLAVLYDAMRYLPDSLTPHHAHGWAEWIHWRDSRNDEELLEEVRDEGGFATIQDVIDSTSVLTRQVFFANMPAWATQPRRTVSRADIVARATDGFSKEVIAACDSLIDAVSVPGFRLKRNEVGCHQASLDSVDGCVVLLWNDGDVVGQVIDDAVNMFAEGDFCEMIDAHPVTLTAKHVRQYQVRTEQMLQVARAVERLIGLVGVPLP